MNLFIKIISWVRQYQPIIIVGLIICIVMQHCTINQLQNELKFVREKYEVVAPQQIISVDKISNADSTIQSQQPDVSSVSKEEITSTKTKSKSPIVAILCLLCSLVVAFFLFKAMGKLPFMLNVTGKLWQDLNGRIIYTLTIKNKTRNDVTVDNAMITFIKRGDTRKFRMPVADFPITLSKGTTHSVNVSLQRLFEQNQDLFNYRAIRVSVDCNGKRKNTLPFAIKWKR